MTEWDSAAVCPCQHTTEPHEPHFYVSAIAGGPPGRPIPMLTCLCPGSGP